MTSEASLPTVIAAVLDTSLFNKGHFHIRAVERLAKRLANRSVALWIPQQVIDEWAVHAAPVLQQLHQAHKRASEAGLVSADVAAVLPAPAISATLRERCADIPNVIVLDMGGQEAVAAIRDQILGTGPGAVVEGVRTGAADSSWVRDSLRCANGNPARIVFVSRNRKDVLATAAEVGCDDAAVRVWDGNTNTFDDFFPPPKPHSTVDEVTAVGAVTTALLADYRSASAADDRSGPPPGWINVVDVSASSDPAEEADGDDSWLGVFAAMQPSARLIDVKDVRVEADGDDTRVYYTVRLLADVVVERLVADTDGSAVTEASLQRDRVLVVPYTAVLRERALRDVEQTDIAQNWPAARRFTDSFDAFHWFFDEEISQWDHIEVTRGRNSGGESISVETEFELRGPYGRSETASVVNFPGDWEVHFENTGVVVSAYYAPDSRAWLGREDSFDRYPPVELRTESPDRERLSPEPYTGLSVLWAYLVDHAG